MSTTTIERRTGRPSAIGERQSPFALRADDDEELDGWTLDGYGAVFNRETVIDSWEGRFREVIANGSMKKSFRESPPIVQFDHGRHPLIGSWPIAELLSVREDSDPERAPEGGAHLMARMFEHLFFEPLRMAIRAKAIKGMSFRFEVVREEWRTADGKLIRDDEQLFQALRETWDYSVPTEDLPVRTLKELRVSEMGPVVWPAYSDTSIGIRSVDLDRLPHDREAQRAVIHKLFAASLAKRSEDNSEPNTQSQSEVAPQATRDADASGAGEHPAELNDAPQATGSEQPAGEHPSSRGLRADQMVALRSIRQMVHEIQLRKEQS